MSLGKWRSRGKVAVVVCAVIILAAFRRDIASAYHHHAMVRAWDKVIEIGPDNSEQSKWIESYERHKDTLVDLGYFVRREFLLVVKPPETSRVWKQVTAEFPDNFHTTMSTTQWGGSENKITVWDRPDRMAAWEACIRKYDVPEANVTGPATAPMPG
jgi:hypothetical protein